MKKWMTLLLSAALLLSGCVAAPGATVPQLATKPTVDDLFTPPVTTTVPDVVNPTEPTQPDDGRYAGFTGLSIVGNTFADDRGGYQLYQGGEKKITFKLSADGEIAEGYTNDGIGILLFLDGQAQPFRVEEGGELRYCHILYPDFEPITNAYYLDAYFTPVSGEKGDMVEYYIGTLMNPAYQSTDAATMWRYTSGSVITGARLLMEATPPKADLPETTERVKSVDVSYADATYDEIGTWSDTDLIERVKFGMYVDGRYPAKQNGFLYDCTASDSVELKFRVWGTPYVKYGLMFFIDNQPITTQEILFDMQSGQKTIITVIIDLSDFDGECALYAALIPRNYTSTEILTDGFLNYSKTYFLLDDPEPVQPEK